MDLPTPGSPAIRTPRPARARHRAPGRARPRRSAGPGGLDVDLADRPGGAAPGRPTRTDRGCGASATVPHAWHSPHRPTHLAVSPAALRAPEGGALAGSRRPWLTARRRTDTGSRSPRRTRRPPAGDTAGVLRRRTGGQGPCAEGLLDQAARRSPPRPAMSGSTWLVIDGSRQLGLEQPALQQQAEQLLVPRRARRLGAHEDVELGPAARGTLSHSGELVAKPSTAPGAGHAVKARSPSGRPPGGRCARSSRPVRRSAPCRAVPPR